MKLGDIKEQPPFMDLYLIDEETEKAIRKSMEEDGYDEGFPVHVWKHEKEYILLDGHTRLKAASNLYKEGNQKFKEIPAVIHEFKTEEEALQYAIHNQRDRRNMTDAVFFRMVELLDKKYPRGGKREKGKSKTEKSEIDSRDRTISLIGNFKGFGKDKVDWVRKILKYDETSGRRGRRANLILRRDRNIHSVWQAIKKAKEKENIKIPEGKRAIINLVKLTDTRLARLNQKLQTYQNPKELADESEVTTLIKTMEEFMRLIGLVPEEEKK